MDNLVTAILLEAEVMRTVNRVSLYASLKYDVDQSDSERQSMHNRISAEEARIMALLAWIWPEILAIPEHLLVKYLNQPKADLIRRKLEIKLRDKPHILSTTEETLLASASDALNAAKNIVTLLRNVDMKFPCIGVGVQVTHATFTKLLENPDREFRKNAYYSLYGTYENFKNSIAACLACSVKTDVFKAQTKHFSSALEANLHEDNVPLTVYTSLIQAVHNSLPVYYDYVALRCKMLKLSQISMLNLLVFLISLC